MSFVAKKEKEGETGAEKCKAFSERLDEVIAQLASDDATSDEEDIKNKDEAWQRPRGGLIFLGRVILPDFPRNNTRNNTLFINPIYGQPRSSRR